MQKQYVRRLFDSIAYRYDLLNHLLSGGIDLYWRRAAIGLLESSAPKRILDVATGTADFAIASLRLNPEEVIGVDISTSMLDLGRQKIEARNAAAVIQLQRGDAEQLEFPENRFDAAIVAFGARNFENLDAGLKEMHRVIRKRGKIVVLEFSKPRLFPFKQIYFLYFRKILPLVGSAISKDREAYKYLPDTVMSFPEGEAFAGILREAGFSSVFQRRLTFGIVTIYSGEK